MGKLYAEIDENLRAFIADQHVFFVATAPSDVGGHVNCSPKGLDSFRVLGPTQVAYVDFVGSGVETIAHLGDNGRIVILFCAFAGPPKIVRLHGRGSAVERNDPRFAELLRHFGRSPDPGVRAVVTVEVTRISDSCGYGVPLYEYRGERDQLEKWVRKKGPDRLESYQREKNASSIDGLRGLEWVNTNPKP